MADLDVRVLITAAADQLRRELSKTSDGVAGFGQKLSSGLNGASERLLGLGKTMSLTVSGPLAALGGGMLALAKSTASAGDEIAKSAKSIGIGGQALQELRFAVGQATDVTEGELNRALQNLNTNMGELATGGASDELVAAFERVGISAADITSGTVGIEEAFSRVNAGLQETGSAAEAAATGAELLGSRVGRSLGPQLRGAGGEVAGLRDQFRELGLGIGDEALGASEQFSDQLSVMGEQFSLAGTKIGTALLPVLVNDLMPFVIDTVIPGLISMGEAVGGLIKWFTELPAPVQAAAGIIAAAIGLGGPILLALGAMAAAFGAIVAVATGPIGLFIGAAALAVTAWTLWGDQIQAVVGGAITWMQETFTGFGEWWTEFWNGLFEGFRATFGGAFTFISGTTTATVEGVKALFQGLGDYLIFGSLIPDMWAGIESVWEGGAARMQSITERLNSNQTRAFTDMASNITGRLSTMLAAWDSHNKAMFIAQRAAAITQALIATFTGIAQALTWGWPMGPIFAAIIGGIGFAQVAAIASTSFGGGGGGGKGGGKGGGGGGGGGGSARGITNAAAAPVTTDAGVAGDQGRQEITLSIDSRRNIFTRDDIEGLIEQLNEALDDNATLRVRT